ncbi:MAG: YihY/virulence factor BrkB family protein [Solirubrobacterales bacterium]|nr:YihY/virulence factor BrkB family protein [Solirubrobacterales bacterium]MBV9364564.1 YihY/virulence factor BrkB family protein [Solirubrobacterales bacterium]MBV9806729.1 YihY/virulence factor BrkB family protein [Solirubrobacterales bacterium]
MATDTSQREQDTSGSNERAPEKPSRLGTRSWVGVLKRTIREFKKDNVTDWAAALTYYGVLAIFPAIIALVSILGLIGPSATQPLITNVGKLAPGSVHTILTQAIQGLQHSRGAAGFIFIVGIAGAIWSASGYISAFMRASNAIYDVEEGRPIWMTLPVRIFVTVLMLALLAISAIAVVMTGGLAAQIGKLLGVGSTAVQVWDIAKWPVLLLVVSFMFSILYWAAPNVKHPGFRWLSPGGVFAVVVWVIASGVFALYVANFSSYNKTYGTLAGVIIFLVWLWVSNIAVLLGAEWNAEIERARVMEAGQPADEEPFVEPRKARRQRGSAG